MFRISGVKHPFCHPQTLDHWLASEPAVSTEAPGPSFGSLDLRPKIRISHFGDFRRSGTSCTVHNHTPLATTDGGCPTNSRPTTTRRPENLRRLVVAPLPRVARAFPARAGHVYRYGANAAADARSAGGGCGVVGLMLGHRPTDRPA